MNVDVLSDVLRAVRLTGAVFFDFDLSAPWAIEAPPWTAITHAMPGAERIFEYHFMAGGSGWAHAVGDEEAIRLQEGDLIIFPQGDAHVLTSEPGLRSPPDPKVYSRLPVLRPLTYEVGGGGERARVICCFLGCDERPFNPLLSALPRVIHLSTSGAHTTTGWLGTLMSAAARESSNARPGTDNVLARLAELMFVETVRRYVETLPSAEQGWLAGLRDPVVGQALAELHAEPRKQWTVDGLARSVGLSRSVLAERFTTMVGQPPMQYLALWRMQLASRLLAGGDQIATVAVAVGYESEPAFSRAFKKLVGVPPATWRKKQLEDRARRSATDASDRT